MYDKLKINVMYIEDDADTSAITQRLLARVFDGIVSFSNSIDALAYLRDGFQVDMIITDIGMPVMNGLEFIRRVKMDFYSPPPIIAVTAHTREYRVALSDEKVAVLEKPFELSALLEIVKGISKIDN